MLEAAQGERVKTVLFYGVVFLLGYLMYQIFKPFLVPLAWAGVLVIVSYPLHHRLVMRFKSKHAAYLSTAIVTLVLIVPVLVIATVFVRQGISAYQSFEEARQQGKLPETAAAIERAWAELRARLPVTIRIDPVQIAIQAAQHVGSFLAGRAGVVAKNVALFFFDLAVMIFAMFYFFRDATPLMDGLRRLLPFDDSLKEQVLTQARQLIEASVTSTLVVAGVQGLLGGLTFLFLGFDAPVVWGVVMAFFALIPLAGTWLVWVPAAISLFVGGEVARGVVLVIVGIALIGSVDNVLRPILVSDRAQLSQLLIFISILGGIGVFGMLGLVLGPIVVATAVGLMKVYTKPAPAKAEPTQAPA